MRSLKTREWRKSSTITVARIRRFAASGSPGCAVLTRATPFHKFLLALWLAGGDSGIGDQLRHLRQAADFRLARPVEFAFIYQQQRLVRPA